MGILLSKQDYHLNEPGAADASPVHSTKRRKRKHSSEHSKPDKAEKKRKLMAPESILTILNSQEVPPSELHCEEASGLKTKVSRRKKSKVPITSEESTPKSKRKQKAPASPYFTPTERALPSPSTTPGKATTRTKQSKISVIESLDSPAPLHHFRPTSPNEFGLIQEKLRDEPWKMLVAVIFLNKTTAKMAIPLLAQLFQRWPTPQALSEANIEELTKFLYPIGLYNVRAKRLKDFSTQWIKDPPQRDVLKVRKGLKEYPPTAISHLPGVSVMAGDVNVRWVYMRWIHGECFVRGRKSGEKFSRLIKSYKHG